MSARGEERVEERGVGRVEGRITARRERVHVLTGAVCNNNCVFCMEEDREGREAVNSRTDDALVRWIVETHPGAEELCFTSGEPTTNPALARWAKLAKDAGVGRVSVMTNGRALSYEPYTRRLLAAGMRRFYVSIHGHTAKLHEGLTRTPGSFEQTVAGIRVVAGYLGRGVELHTSTVITKRNLPHLGEIYRFLRGLGVQQVVFNVMQANGRAHTHFDKIFPRYSEIAATARAFLEEARREEPRPMAFLVDIPLCTTEGIDDFHRGYVERYVHFEPPGLGAHDRALAPEHAAERTGPAGDLVQIRRSDLDDAARAKRPECARCRYDAVCEGVWLNYLARYGWDELVPVVNPPGR
ncbi:MAG: radical SAM protein [Sandaracinaceae bacterium]|nr:radical SAM protein [Sandaracinaceae bacterium]